MAAGGHLGKLQMVISQQRIIRLTVCMYADHTLPSVSSLMEIWNLPVFHTGESLADLQYKEKEPKGRSWKTAEKITREEYTLDWSQSKVFLVIEYVHWCARMYSGCMVRVDLLGYNVERTSPDMFTDGCVGMCGFYWATMLKGLPRTCSLMDVWVCVGSTGLQCW